MKIASDLTEHYIRRFSLHTVDNVIIIISHMTYVSSCVGPYVLLRLCPVLLHAEVVDEGRAAPVEEEIEHVHEEVLDDQAHNHAYCLHNVVDQVELHGHQVPPLPSILCSITQACHLVVLFVDEPR